jgi:YD repeat-containing protein
MRSPQGLRVQYVRDGQRNLKRLISPGGHTIDLETNPAGRVTEAHDDKGHRVSYLYDEMGRLLEVRDGGAVAVRYSYDDRSMLAVLDGAGQPLAQNRYSRDRLVQQILADGKVYEFRYVLARSEDVYAVQTVVTLPDQSHITLNFRNGVLVRNSSSGK